MAVLARMSLRRTARFIDREVPGFHSERPVQDEFTVKFDDVTHVSDASNSAQHAASYE